MPPKQPPKEPKPKFKEPRTKWKNSQAKKQLYDDLVEGDTPIDDSGDSDELLLEWYNSNDEYKKYDPDLFKGRLDGLRKTIAERQSRARDDRDAYQQFKEQFLLPCFCYQREKVSTIREMIGMVNLV